MLPKMSARLRTLFPALMCCQSRNHDTIFLSLVLFDMHMAFLCACDWRLVFIQSFVFTANYISCILNECAANRGHSHTFRWFMPLLCFDFFYSFFFARASLSHTVCFRLKDTIFRFLLFKLR